MYIFLILLLLPLTMRSQEDISIGKKQSLYSAVLNEERNYWIHLPAGYEQDTTKRYPVIYLLDGDAFFHSLVGISRTFTTVRGKYLPESIIIGVLNVDRTRDLTPTASAAGRDGRIAPDATPQGGGSETFSRFLTEELLPDERKEYADRPFLRGTVHPEHLPPPYGAVRHLSGCRPEPVVGPGQAIAGSCRMG